MRVHCSSQSHDNNVSNDSRRLAQPERISMKSHCKRVLHSSRKTLHSTKACLHALGLLLPALTGNTGRLSHAGTA